MCDRPAFPASASTRMITRMSETPDERPVAPGIAQAMRNARNADQLSDRHRHRWSLPSDRETSNREHAERDASE